MDPQTAAPPGMTRGESSVPVPYPPPVIPEFAQQISGTLFLSRVHQTRDPGYALPPFPGCQAETAIYPPGCAPASSFRV